MVYMFIMFNMYLHNDSALTAKDFFTYGDYQAFEENVFWKIPLAFNDKRHVEKIEVNSVPFQQTWRMKERMKTVSVALVLCLNIGVDPPDLIKISPCARLECWKDPNLLVESLPTSNSTLGTQQKPIDVIGAALQKQYERWQPRARYKLTLDPTLEDVKKLCLSLRRNAKDERVLLHYNGHGVPRPTNNGEIWVFNKHYTQYIPLSVIDLQTWMGRPSIYVFDCSNAGYVVDYLTTFLPPKSDDIENSYEDTIKEGLEPRCSYENILLVCCKKDELLPMNANLPADLFTSCLTTPIKIGVRWFILTQSSVLVPDLTIENIEKIPGQLNDRRTMLGELNWIFTAITDTIAWNNLPRDLFQKLFRQDLLVASLFRNFLLAERIMRSYNCTPISFPKLPATHNHHMWQAWDMALDNSLLQLSNVLKDPNSYQHSNFFAEQLTAFQVWLDCASDKRSPPEQLPIVLQVLLSQIHRHRALELLGKFLDLGHWAVNLALSVGIFPYVLKLLQSSARELRPLLIFIWAKLLAVDISCQTDLIKDNGHKYFLSVLSDSCMPSEQRMMAAFILTMIVNDNRSGQEVALKDNVISLCLDQLYDRNAMLRQWVLLCLAKTWTKFDDARWYGVRDNAHDQISLLLSDEIAEVRTSAVYALGKFISNESERSDQVIKLEQSIATLLLATLFDASPMVRKELIIALSGFVLLFESQFVSVCIQTNEDEVNREYHTFNGAVFNQAKYLGEFGLKRSSSAVALKDEIPVDGLKRISGTGMSGGSAVERVWKSLIYLSNDCFDDVASTANKIVNYVKSKTKQKTNEETKINRSRKISAPIINNIVGSSTLNQHLSRNSNSNPRTPDRSPVSRSELSPKVNIVNYNEIEKLSSNFFKWSCNYFSEPLTRTPDHMDPQGTIYFERQYRYIKADKMLKIAKPEQIRSKHCKSEEQIFTIKQNEIPRLLRFHPYETQLAIAETNKINIYDWEQGSKVSTLLNRNPKLTRITSMDFVNAHDDALLMIGTDDSAVRIWKHYCKPDRQPHMLTAWWTLSDMIPVSKGSGLLLEFDAMTGNLFASGDARYIRIWDVNKETKIQDMLTHVDSSITSLSLEKSAPMHPHLIIGACADGKVQVFDTRLRSNNSVVRTFHRHTSLVIRANTLQQFPNYIVSGSSKGELMLWDFRSNKVVQSIYTSVNITSIDAHPNAEIIACGTMQQGVLTFNHEGESLGNIKQSHSFIGTRFGSISCLSFHPIKVRLAIAREDMTVTVYNLIEGKKKSIQNL